MGLVAIIIGRQEIHDILGFRKYHGDFSISVHTISFIAKSYHLIAAYIKRLSFSRFWTIFTFFELFVLAKALKLGH